MKTNLFTLVAVLGALLAGSCGYKVSGRYTGLPEGIQTIAVPVFDNRTPKFELEQILTAAVKRELAERSNRQVISDKETADAVLTGTILSYSITPIGIKSENVGTSFSVMIVVDVSFYERKTGKVLYANPSFVIREEYTLSNQTKDFYLEEGPAIERASRSFAASLVPTILESF
jgi:outer membrane lipopolysaccharide assembly protein LptE/RlpB